MTYISIALGIAALVAFCYFARQMVQAVRDIEPSFHATFQDSFPLLAEAIKSLPSRIVVEPSITVEVAAPECSQLATPPVIEVSVEPSEVVIHSDSTPAPIINVQVEPTPIEVNLSPSDPPDVQVHLSVPEGAAPAARREVFSPWDEREGIRAAKKLAREKS
jgi:hypothetical protein